MALPSQSRETLSGSFPRQWQLPCSRAAVCRTCCSTDGARTVRGAAQAEAAATAGTWAQCPRCDGCTLETTSPATSNGTCAPCTGCSHQLLAITGNYRFKGQEYKVRAVARLRQHTESSTRVLHGMCMRRCMRLVVVSGGRERGMRRGVSEALTDAPLWRRRWWVAVGGWLVVRAHPTG